MFLIFGYEKLNFLIDKNILFSDIKKSIIWCQIFYVLTSEKFKTFSDIRKSKSHLQRKMAWCQISFILISGNLKNVSYLKQISFSSYLKYLAFTKDSNVGS